MKKYILFFLILGITVIAQAQSVNKWPNTLLWKISGKGLEKPSFLYGTMHLQDKRLFNFGDSLYHYLEKVDGYALEIDLQEFMDSIMQRGINEGVNEAFQRRKLKPAEEKKLVDSLLKVVEQSNDGDSKKKLKKIRDDRMNSVTKKEMPTIMDAYLFGIAKAQGKWVGGIEDVQDQIHIYDEMGKGINSEDILMSAEKMKKRIEEMVGIYIAQDLNKIENYFTNSFNKTFEDILFTRRNIKMARRMDSLSSIRTMFFAVGAAHLPGDSGVINLLRRNGYKVEPVFSSKKIAPENYKYVVVDQPWVLTGDDKQTYTIEMPGKPSEMNILNDLFKMKVYTDISTLTFFMSGSTFAQMNIDAGVMLDEFSKNIKGTLEDKKIIEKQGAKGFEAVLVSEGSYFKVQFLVKNTTGYMIMAGGEKRSQLESKEVKKYFNSLVIKNKPVSKADKVWETLKVAEKGFTVEMPGKPQRNKVIERSGDNTSWNFTAYDVVDENTGKYFAVQIRDIRPGYYLPNDTAYFSSLKTDFIGKIDSVTKETVFQVQTFPAFRYDGNMKGKLSAATLNVVRGNRIYFLMVVSTTKIEGDPEIERFLNSFSLATYEPAVTKKEWAPDKSFYAILPAPIIVKAIVQTETDAETIVEKDTTIKYKDLVSYNPNEAISYQVFKEIIPKYFWTTNDSTMFQHFGMSYKGYWDSILYNVSTQNGSIKGMEWVIKSPGSNNLKKLRQLLNGDTLYTLLSYIPSQYINSKENTQFFESFRIVKENTNTTVYTSKASLLLNNLLSKDSATFTDANNALGTVSFEKKELPLLHDALLQNYLLDTFYYYNSIAAKLTREINKFPDTSTLLFVEKNFEKLTGEKETIKLSMLNLLANYKTADSYDLLKRMWLQHVPKPKVNDNNFRHFITDSLALAKRLFPEILSLTNNRLFAEDVIEISTELLDSNYISLQMLEPYQSAILYTADTLLQSLRNKKEIDNGYHYDRILHLLGKFNTVKSNALLEQYQYVNDLTIKEFAIMALLANNKNVNSKELDKIAADNSSRIGLYEALKKINKLNFFPLKYKTQQYLAQSQMHIYASDDYDPSEIIFIGERTVEYKGSKQKFYLYKVVFRYDEDVEEEQSTYLGIAGPFSMNAKEIESSYDATGLVWDEEYDAKKIDQAFKKFIKEMAAYTEEKE